MAHFVKNVKPPISGVTRKEKPLAKLQATSYTQLTKSVLLHISPVVIGNVY